MQNPPNSQSGENPKKQHNWEKIETKIIQTENDAVNVFIKNKPAPKWKEPALFISLLALAFTVWYNIQTHLQWTEINTARMAIEYPQFYTFRTLSFDSPYMDSIDATQIPGDPVDNPNYALVKYLIAAYYKDQKTPIPGSFALTPYLSKKELEKRNIPDSGVYFKRLFRPQVTIQNVGQTPCEIDSIVVR